jgi:pSer/pThr/pTyr-binding forkhead associated (FHA) protein
MLGQLAPCGGGPVIPLLKPKLLVGRQSICDVALPYAAVSSRHCELEFLAGYWLVRDLGSRNGTRVNGSVCASQWLMPNDILAVAHYRYGVGYTAPPGRPPAALPGVSGGISSARTSPVQRPREAPIARMTPDRAVGASTFGHLVPCGGGDPIPLRDAKLVVGRHDICDIMLPIPTVSGRHCELEFANGYWYVRDLGSRNGVRVDGVRCETDRLKPGCVLWVAGLRFQVVYSAPTSAAEPPAKGPVFAQSLLQAAGLVRWQADQPDPTKRKRDEEAPARPRYNLDDPE